MDLPIDNKELDILVRMTEKMAGDGLGKRDVDAEKLFNKLRLVKFRNLFKTSTIWDQSHSCGSNRLEMKAV